MTFISKLKNMLTCRSGTEAEGGADRGDLVTSDAFLRAFLGKHLRSHAETSLNDPLKDPFNSISVGSDLTSALVISASSKSAKTGVIDEVESYLYDALRRRLGLSIAAEALLDSRIPAFKSTLPEDVLVGMMLTTSNKRRLGRWAARNVGMALPWVAEDANGSLVDFSDCLGDLLAQPGSRTMLWMGCSSGASNNGKTYLLRQLFPAHFRNASEGVGSTRSRSVDVRLPFSISKSGKFGSTWDETVLLDVNGNCNHDSVNSLMKNCSLTVVNVYPSDSSNDAMNIINQSRRSVVLLRDFDGNSNTHKKLQSINKQQFPGFLGFVEVPSNLPPEINGQKSTIPRSAQSNSQVVGSNVRSVRQFLQNLYPTLPGTASIDSIKGLSPHPSLSRLASELTTLLDQARVSQSTGLRSFVFPYSALQARQLGLQRKERRLKEEGQNAQLVTVQQQLALVKSQIADISHITIHPVLQWFCQHFILKGSVVNPSSKSGNFSLYALARLLDEWKAPLLEPLYQQRRDVLDLAASTGDAKYNQQLIDINKSMDELEITVDGFWTELEVMVGFYGLDNPHLLPVPKEQFYKKYAECVALDGFPLQLLKGSPLHLADPACLKGVLQHLTEAVEANSTNRSGSFTGSSKGTDQFGVRSGPAKESPQVLVVSVIGAQSSAKSTLLNFLFGCEFETRSGRCTKGLYASFQKLPDGKVLVVLDSEGLLSVEASAEHSEYGGSEIFDGQMTLLAMACSHLVLINHKGEISRQLQDLLEVCMFAMKHLKVANFQPLVSFVLRDQHDRSPSVHEDTLRHMRRHLADCASRLGIKLEEILRLDASSIHLLPSAFSTEKTAGKGEVEVLNEVFGNEILQVRNSILARLNQETPFGNLTQWVAHASVVWETLVQFGHNLLHYKTIQEIELKREANNIASDLIRDTLDKRFKPKASELINSYNAKLANTRLEDLDALDIEVSGNLNSLKQSETTRLLDSFEKLTAEKRFTESIKQPERERLAPALDFAHDNLVYTWKLLLRQARDGQEAQGLWAHFSTAMEKMVGAERRAITEEEARQMFEKEWNAYEQQCKDRLEQVKRDKAGIAYEVSVVFNHALQKVAREREDFAVLKQIGAVENLSSLMSETEEDWHSKYVKSEHRSLGENSLDKTPITQDELNRQVSKDLKIVRALVEDLSAIEESDIERYNAVSEASAIDWLRKSHDLVTSEADRRVRAIEIKRPQLLSAIHLQLRHTAVNKAWQMEQAKYTLQLQNLEKQKSELEEHLVTMAKSNASDVERARSFAERYHAQLIQWLDFVVTSFAAEVRSTVLAEMPDPAKAHERAFQQSFGARNWIEVLEYCLDVNAYLEKLFLTLFHRRQVAVVAARQPQLEQRVADMYAVLKECAMDWSRSVGTDGKSWKLESLQGFLKKHKDASSDESAMKGALSIFPQTMNFEIKDTRIFASTFAASMTDLYNSVFPSIVEEKVIKCLNEQSVEAWALLKGCSARCPLCGSKCDKLGDHADHSCGHHLFPAFHGWMDRQTGKPSLSLCQSDDVHHGTYQCRDGTWRPLKEYLEDSHRSWCPFPSGFAENQKDDENILKAAWVNTKRALEKYFKPMKAVNPMEWDCFFEVDRALTDTDLDKAKRVIKAIRAKKWSPSKGILN